MVWVVNLNTQVFYLHQIVIHVTHTLMISVYNFYYLRNSFLIVLIMNILQNKKTLQHIIVHLTVRALLYII